MKRLICWFRGHQWYREIDHVTLTSVSDNATGIGFEGVIDASTENCLRCGTAALTTSDTAQA